MDQEKTFPMTETGKIKLEQELNDLITVKRPEITNRIQIARSFGDLSENSEYQSAKDEQAFVEGKIKNIQNMIRNSEIISEENDNPDLITIGKNIIVQELPNGEDEKYQIVGIVEADPFNGKISNDSPMAKALMNHKKGDKVKFSLPNGNEIELLIKEIIK